MWISTNPAAGTVDATTFFAKKISGVGQRLDLPGDHPLTGRSAPDLELAAGSRLADHLHEGRALLLDLADDPALRDRSYGYEDRLTVLTTGCADTGLAALFVRPDGFVAWASDVGQEDLGSLDKALPAWLGSRPMAG